MNVIEVNHDFFRQMLPILALTVIAMDLATWVQPTMALADISSTLELELVLHQELAQPPTLPDLMGTIQYAFQVMFDEIILTIHKVEQTRSES
jgi:hypothetical protein